VPNPAIWCISYVATVNIIVPGKRALVRVTYWGDILTQTCEHRSRALEQSVSGAENGAGRAKNSDERNSRKKNERSAEREVAEWERSGERAESAAHADKACTICTLHFSEAMRGPGPGTSRLDFGGSPMTFLVCPHFHPNDQSCSLCNVCIHYNEHCRVVSTVYTVSEKKT